MKGADVYFFRWIFHDWSNTYGAKLLRNLIPALKKGAKVVISEICIPPPGLLPLYDERSVRWVVLLVSLIPGYTNGVLEALTCL